MLKGVGILVSASVAVSIVMTLIVGDVNVLSVSGVGVVLGQALAVVSFTIVIAVVPPTIYWLIKRKLMTGLNKVVWVIWALLYSLSFAGEMM